MDLHGLQGNNLPHHGLLQGLQGNNLPHHGLLQGLQGNLCSGPWSTSSPSFFSCLGVCRVVSLTFLSLSHCVFFPLLKYLISEVLPLSLIGSASVSSGSILELADIGSIRHGGSFWQLLTEATPVALPLPKPCHTNPLHLFAE